MKIDDSIRLIVDIVTAVISIVALYITYKVSKSTDKNSEETLNINKRLEEMEKRNEGPAVIISGSSIASNSNVIYYDSTDGHFKGYLRNIGSGPAINLKGHFFLKNNDVPVFKNIKFGSTEHVNIPKESFYPDISLLINQGDSNFHRYSFNLIEPSYIPKNDCAIVLELEYQSTLGVTFKTTSQLDYDLNSKKIEIKEQNIEMLK